MDDGIGKDARTRVLVAAALEGRLTEAQAAELAGRGERLLKLVLLAAAQWIAEQNTRIAQLEGRVAVAGAGDPSTPSGQRPIYTKPPAPGRKGKPGARPGHVGSRRPAPAQIDRREEHRLEVCPDCGGELQRCRRKRTRTVEDILKDLRTEVTEHTASQPNVPSDLVSRCARALVGHSAIRSS